MASSFNGALRKVRATLARDRKHAESRLQKATAGLYAKLAANMAAQRKKNHALAAATRRMRLDAMDAVFRAKKAFRAKIASLGRTVAKNDRVAEKKIFKLTGIVKKNAQKSAAGRRQLRIIEQRNKEELSLSIKNAIAKGEKRAQLVEQRGKKMDKDTAWLTNQRLTEQITRLEKQTTKKVDALALESAKARKDLQKEMYYATKSAAEVAKNNLDAAMRRSVKRMEAFAARAAAAHKYSAGQRKEVNRKIAINAKKIKREIADAVLGSEKANNAFAEQTSNKMKKLKTRVDYESARMKKITENNRKKLKAQELATETSIRNEERRATLELKKFKSKDKAALKKAEKKADDMFGKAYKKLANERSAFDLKLGAATTNLNRALSKQAALNTANFRTSVKDIKKARKEAAHQVKVLRKEFATGMLGVVAESKRVNQRIVSEIQVVTGEVRSMKSAQILVNARVARELKQINRVADRRWSAAKRARGRLKKQ